VEIMNTPSAVLLVMDTTEEIGQAPVLTADLRVPYVELLLCGSFLSMVSACDLLLLLHTTQLCSQCRNESKLTQLV
jgi:hypothetical protein